MTSLPQPREDVPVPFFTDTRTLPEKLGAEQREWRPHQPQHGCPNWIFGLVIERGEYHSSYGDNKRHETARILTADNVVWSVVAFHGYLQAEFDRKQPRVGDFVGVIYKGTRPAKKAGESDAHDYQLEVERNPAAQVPVEETDRGGESLAGSDPAPPLPALDEEPGEQEKGR